MDIPPEMEMMSFSTHRVRVLTVGHMGGSQMGVKRRATRFLRSFCGRCFSKAETMGGKWKITPEAARDGRASATSAAAPPTPRHARPRGRSTRRHRQAAPRRDRKRVGRGKRGEDRVDDGG